MAVERSELRLIWPAALFAREARALLNAGADDDSLAGLLAEAFHDRRGERLLRQIADQQGRSWSASADPWSTGGPPVRRVEPYNSRPTAKLVVGLVDDAATLPRYVPRPLFRERQRESKLVTLTGAEVKRDFALLVEELTHLGYFEDAFGSECGDSGDDPDAEGQRRLAIRLDLDPDNVQLWPLRYYNNVFRGAKAVPNAWPEHVLFDMIEALDEVVARPRQRHWHSHYDEWDYSDYSRPAGQMIYRWKVNLLLDRSDIPLRLAETGEDAGLLVTSTTDARVDLIEQALETPDTEVRGLVAHAVATFRGRDATALDKRTACKYLADVLETRRNLLRQHLLTKDESALYQIANSFQIRHLNEQQKGDYDPDFLDWVFWWYLGTIELTNRLLERSGD